MKHKISQKQVISCLETLIDNSTNNAIIDKEWLHSYFSDAKKLECLLILQSYGVVSPHFYDGKKVPGYITIENNAFALLHQVYNDNRKEIKGIIEGVVSTVAAEIIIILVLQLLQI